MRATSAKVAVQLQDAANSEKVSKRFSIGAERALINGEITSASIEITDGFITAVDSALPVTAADIHVLEGVLSPGFIDCQINGIAEINFFDADKEQMEEALALLASHGVTACTPSMISAPIGELVAAINTSDCGEASSANAPRALHLGYHIEGPFLSDQFARAHNARYFLDPSRENLQPLLESGRVAIVTLAPERPGALEAIASIRSAGAIASVGHSAATYDQMSAAISAGLNMVTHLFNGMDKDVANGIIRAACESEELTVGFIADGIHNDQEKVEWAFAHMGERIALVTDALGSMLGDEPVRVTGQSPGGAYRNDGTLAGSTLTLDQVLLRAISMGVPLTQALTSVTRTPARALGRRDVGEIRVGARADLTIFGEGGSIRTWVGGVEVKK